MPTTIEAAVSRHYSRGDLLDRIRAALGEAGVGSRAVTAEDLKPVDEFHIGGIAATRALIEQVPIGPDARVLDIGSGIGGTARHVAREYGASVTGIDLTPDFVDAAAALSDLVGLADRTAFRVASALDMPFEDAAFDAALLLHVGMNLPDKPRLMGEAARVLRPGATFAIYDVMTAEAGPLAFPVPWAESAETSFVASPDVYHAAAAAKGFSVVATRARSDFALQFFADLRARIAESGPPPVGLHLLMGESTGEKIANMVRNIADGLIAPTEMILRKAPA